MSHACSRARTSPVRQDIDPVLETAVRWLDRVVTNTLPDAWNRQLPLKVEVPTMTRTILVSCVLLSLAIPAAAQMAGTYTVQPLLPTGGTNFATINEAITALQTQGVMGPVNIQLFDDGGPFTEMNPVTTIINTGTAVMSIQGNLVTGVSATNRVTIEPFPGESPVLDATGQNFGVQMVTCQYFTIRGLEVFGALADGISCYADGASGASGALLGNEIIGNKVHDIAGCGINIYANLGTGAWFDGTVVRNNFLWSCQVTHGGQNNSWRHGYLNERRSRNAIIENNTFYGDTGVGPSFGLIVTYYSPGVGAPAASVRNNLLVKTVANGSLHHHVDAGSIALAMDNNVYDDQSGGNFMSGASGVYATLIAFQLANPTLEVSSIPGSADLVNPAVGDLHILPTSAAIDAGTPLLGVPDDIDGDPRPQGLGWDAGADEFVATALSISMTQSAPGAPITIDNANLVVGTEYFNLFSLDLCPGGPGSGPIFGGCVGPNVQFLLNQLMAPIGAAPFHIIAPASNVSWGPYSVGPITVDAICIEMVGGAIGATSPVVRLTVQ